jgi:hypothetical protein
MRRYTIIAGLGLLGICACSENIMDAIDRNPNQPTDVPVSLLLPQAAMNTVRGIGAGGTAQAAANFVEHTAVVRINPITPRNVDDSMWNATYSSLMDLAIIIERGSAGGAEEGEHTYVGIAKVLYAFALASATDMYGEMPHSQALRGSEERNPPFDEQEEMYTYLLALLDEAIVDLGQPAISDPGSHDLIFQGDTALWRATAYGLKARYLNRLSNIDPTGSAEAALEASSRSFAGPHEGFIFRQYQTSDANQNPYAAHQRSQNTWAVSTTFLQIMNEYTDAGVADDPRADLWWHTIDDEFVGAPPGRAVEDGGHVIYSSPKLQTIIAQDAEQPVMTFDELKFIEAEAHLRLGNASAAYEAYEEAVRAGLLRTGVSAAAAEAYMNQGNVLPGPDNLTLEDILTQKYMSFWLVQAEEAYADIRRTNIPDVARFVHPDGFPLRIPYPLAELDRNANAPRHINDVTIYSIPVWWAQRP